MFQGIGEEVAQYFFQFVAIHPYMVITLRHIQFQSDALHLGGFLEGSYQLAQFLLHIHFRCLQSEGIGFQLIEVEHLVYQPQHSVHAHAHPFQCLMHRGWQTFISIQCHQWTGDDGDRVAELVGDVSKETHIHLLGMLLSLMLPLLLQELKLVGASSQIESIEIINRITDDAEIEQPCRRRIPKGWLDGDFHLPLFQRWQVGRGHQAQAEHILAWGEIGEFRLMLISRGTPMLVVPLQHVLVHQSRTTAVVGIEEAKHKVVLIISESIMGFMAKITFFAVVAIVFFVAIAFFTVVVATYRSIVWFVDGKHFALWLLRFQTIDAQRPARMLTNQSGEEVGVHGWWRQEFTTFATTKHDIAIRRQTNAVVEELPSIGILTRGDQPVHHDCPCLRIQTEGISHRRDP